MSARCWNWLLHRRLCCQVSLWAGLVTPTAPVSLQAGSSMTQDWTEGQEPLPSSVVKFVGQPISLTVEAPSWGQALQPCEPGTDKQTHAQRREDTGEDRREVPEEPPACLCFPASVAPSPALLHPLPPPQAERPASISPAPEKED